MNIESLSMHIHGTEFLGKNARSTRQVCRSMRINRLLDARQSIQFVPRASTGNRIQGIMFKFLVLCCLLVVVHGGWIAPAPLVKKIAIAPAPVAVKIAPLEIKSVPLIKAPLTWTVAEPKAVGWNGGWGDDNLGWNGGWNGGLKL
ncbi:hypothetical protein DMN91_012932 [Ooceraea biroi]|uniref:Uncharacterized protein n=1 Tax=Ooceraea biroi TaxID=2015173 RepID=A0A3L8D3G8_OOCBI|nr:hypothetical protein DMN91_012932 [Ooceraea biroi]